MNNGEGVEALEPESTTTGEANNTASTTQTSNDTQNEQKYNNRFMTVCCQRLRDVW